MKVITRAEKQHRLTREEIIELLASDKFNRELFAAADRVRSRYVGNAVHLRTLIEFSNICKRNCLYCGLRRENEKLKRYRLGIDTIIDLARKARSLGYKTIVLQSGEDDFYTADKMATIIREIKAMDLAITLSVGEKSREEYAIYKDAGADRYLLRIETTDRCLYEKLDPGMQWENRVGCLRNLKELGFETGTGCLVGLPGQTIESLADDILFFKNIDADMVGIGPFIPNAHTPLGKEKGGTFEYSLKMIAITRLLMPDVHIPATTAMEALNSKARIIALQSGANVVMPNSTEGEYRKLYMIYPGKICINETPGQCWHCINSKIGSIGRWVSSDYGFRSRNYRLN